MEKELGTGETSKVTWELRIVRRELEDEGWTVCYTDGSGLDQYGNNSDGQQTGDLSPKEAGPRDSPTTVCD